MSVILARSPLARLRAMGPLASALLGAALWARTCHPVAASNAECSGADCEADEAGLLQSSPGVRGHGARDWALAQEEQDETETSASFAEVFGKAEQPANTIERFDPDDIGQALEMGDSSNIGDNDPAFASSGLDLSGYWYLDWRPKGSLAIQLYKKLRLEIAVTFAGSKVINYTNDNSSFSLEMPGQLKHHWAYSNTQEARAQMYGHALNWYSCKKLTYEMKNATHGNILGIGEFTRISADVWSRPTKTLAGTYTYNLARIVYANGTRTKYYPRYAKLMDGYELAVWGNNNNLARCKATAPAGVFGDASCYAFIDMAAYCD
eukprot:CAMPEP_0171183644 /NCGR_PEP_ID=MMETSP0790-20130122/15384_1 /TAXON_ID=2925 /ORGANISM="Alexandrium catenella, Strain OF101" /LENGTH=320 /DNA_ID=CAMNT_0011648625 /DNA_START=8 /DNA_END=970 /DNA_ORIENTATION=-